MKSVCVCVCVCVCACMFKARGHRQGGALHAAHVALAQHAEQHIAYHTQTHTCPLPPPPSPLIHPHIFMDA